MNWLFSNPYGDEFAVFFCFAWLILGIVSVGLNLSVREYSLEDVGVKRLSHIMLIIWAASLLIWPAVTAILVSLVFVITCFVCVIVALRKLSRLIFKVNP